MNNAPGRTLLKVTGILLIIGAVISIFGSLIIILGGGVAAAGLTGDAQAVAGGGFLILIGFLTLLVGIFDLVTGILGVKNCSKPEKGALCLKLGIVLIILSLLSGGMTLISTFNVQNALSLIAGLVIPIIYAVGANKNKGAVEI